MYLSWLPVPVSSDKAFFSAILRRHQWWSSCFSSSHSAGGHSCIMTDWDLAFCLRVLLRTRITTCCLLLAWSLRWWFYTYLSHGSIGSHDLITFSIEDHFSHPGYKTYEEVQALLTAAAAEQYEEVYLFSSFIVLILNSFQHSCKLFPRIFKSMEKLISDILTFILSSLEVHCW